MSVDIVAGEVDWFPDMLDENWETGGLIVRLSPKDAEGNWYTEVSYSANIRKSPKFKTIPDLYDEGKTVVVKSSGLPLSDYEANWLEGSLFKELSQTVMPFKCGTITLTNIINLNRSLAEKWDGFAHNLISVLSDEGYDISAQKLVVEKEESVLRQDDKETNFGGVFKVRTRVVDTTDAKRIQVDVVDVRTNTLVLSTSSHVAE